MNLRCFSILFTCRKSFFALAFILRPIQADPKKLTPELKALTESFGISARLAPHVKGRGKKVHQRAASSAAPRPTLQRRLAPDPLTHSRIKSPSAAASVSHASAPLDDWPSARKSARDDDD
jgi:hypothetical protein